MFLTNGLLYLCDSRHGSKSGKFLPIQAEQLFYLGHVSVVCFFLFKQSNCSSGGTQYHWKFSCITSVSTQPMLPMSRCTQELDSGSAKVKWTQNQTGGHHRKGKNEGKRKHKKWADCFQCANAYYIACTSVGSKKIYLWAHQVFYRNVTRVFIWWQESLTWFLTRNLHARLKLLHIFCRPYSCYIILG